MRSGSRFPQALNVYLLGGGLMVSRNIDIDLNSMNSRLRSRSHVGLLSDHMHWEHARRAVYPFEI